MLPDFRREKRLDYFGICEPFHRFRFGVRHMRKDKKPAVKSDVNLVNLIERFGTDEKCRQYLTELRWPLGVQCPRCNWKGVSTIAERGQYDCNVCSYQFSVTSNTIFHDSHLQLWKWF